MSVPAYETIIGDPKHAFEEMGKFFMDKGNINEAVRDLSHKLDEAHIPYALIGALALAQHGMVRATVDIDVLITKQGLAEFRAKYEGVGYVPAFQGSQKKFRSTETGVRIDFITTGEYPGDGKPKPVVFPDPATSAVEINGLRVIALERYIELKLASGMSATHRVQDIPDVFRLIQHLHLPLDFAEKLDASVRDQYRDVWQKVQAAAEDTVEGPSA